MIAVITGDISNSRQGEVKLWLANLKAALSKFGDSPNDWEIFRGDSFQLKIETSQALKAAIYIKAYIKELKDIDVRMSIGLGIEEHSTQRVSESNGSVYIHSGEGFESMKKQKLVLRSEMVHEDRLWNTMFGLAMLTANTWTTVEANLVRLAIDHKELNQKELTKLIGKSQSTVSATFKRSGYQEIMNMCQLFERKFS